MSRTGRAKAGPTAACACSFDIPPTGTPASVTPGSISTGGAASPRRAGASAATTRVMRARRRINGVESYLRQRHLPRSRAKGGAPAAAVPLRIDDLRGYFLPEKDQEGRRHGRSGAAEDRPGDRRGRQGDPRGGRERRHDQETLRLDRRRVERGSAARVPRPPLRARGRRGVHRRGPPLRPDAPPELGRRDPLPEAARTEGN